MVYAITIPLTSESRYIGGIAALNLPSSIFTGDWHMEETFFQPRKKLMRSFISGEGCITNTNALLGNIGIYDCTQLLEELRIPYQGSAAYAASHARAITDLVLVAVFAGGSPNYVILDDWMPRESDKQAVFDLLAQSLNHLTHDQRLKVEDWRTKNTI